MIEQVDKKPTPIEVEPFEGHMMLLTKNHYDLNGQSFVEAARKVWAVRCGLELRYVIDGQADSHIANSLYQLLKKVNREYKMELLMDRVHRELGERIPFLNRHKGRTPIEALISIYMGELRIVQVNTSVKGLKKSYPLIKLPKPRKRTINKILKGNGEYDDYNRVVKGYKKKKVAT